MHLYEFFVIITISLLKGDDSFLLFLIIKF